MSKHIDPIYKQYAARIIKYVASTDFYEYFMLMLENGKHTMQFSNRRVEKLVDETWVNAIEAAVKPMEEIVNNPRNFIVQEEIIVNVALAKRVTPDTIQHLAQHGSMVDEFDEEEGVRPNRLMEKSKEDSWNTYENRFVYTLLEMTYEFVNKRYEVIFSALNQEEGAFLKISSQSSSYHEAMDVNVDIRLKQVEDLLSADQKNENIFARIARLHRLLTNFRSSSFAKEVSKYGKIKPPVVRTNAIAKNPNFKACYKLWNFLMAYKDVGYTINIYDQNPEISNDFMMDIFHSVMFDYIILKNYLENPDERAIYLNKKAKHKEIKPKFLTEVIEEVVKDYDVPDVEIRKILREDITMERLMQEEAKERRRLVEAKEREERKRRLEEEKERARIEREAAKEKARLEREAERERLRLEKERAEEEARKERLRKQFELEQSRLEKSMASEITKSLEDIDLYVTRRAAAIELEKENERKQREAEAERERLLKEKEKAEQEKARLREKAAKEREEKLAKERAVKEKEMQIAREKAAREREIARAKAAKEKEEQLAKERAVKEREMAKAKAIKEKEAQLAKEKAAKEREIARAKAAKEKEIQLAKEKAAKERELAKAKAAKEKAAELAKEKAAKERELAKAKAIKEKEKQIANEAAIRERRKARAQATLERRKQAALEKAAEKEALLAAQAAQPVNEIAEDEAAELARAVAEKEAIIAAEEAKLAAEKVAAEEARLAAEKAAAEEARLAAEKAAAEEARLAAEKAAAEEAKLAAEKAAAEEAKLAAEKAAAEEARLAAEKAAAEEAELEAEAPESEIEAAEETEVSEATVVGEMSQYLKSIYMSTPIVNHRTQNIKKQKEYDASRKKQRSKARIARKTEKIEEQSVEEKEMATTASSENS